jgi:hypothetical protein
MQYTNSFFRPSTRNIVPAGNPTCWRGAPDCTGRSAVGSTPGDGTLAQSTSAMKNSSNQKVSVAGGNTSLGNTTSVQDNFMDSDIPVFAEYYDPEFPASRILPSPEENSFRNLLKSRLPQLKASQALRERIRLAVENSSNYLS